jgi:hypothetical protein
MKALSMTLVIALTVLASTSNAFCMKQYMASFRINDNSTNFATQMVFNNSFQSHNNNSNAAPVKFKK